MIVVFGRKDLGTGILRNMTNGGQGVSGRVASKYFRKRIKELHISGFYKEKCEEFFQKKVKSLQERKGEILQEKQKRYILSRI